MGIFYPSGREGAELESSEFEVDVFDLINIETLNDMLDKAREKAKKKGVATDIDYECVSVSPLGGLKLKATFLPEEF